MGALTALFHLGMVVHYGYGIYIYLYGVNPPEEIRKLRSIGMGQLKYLTFWDMLLQCSYFTFAFINDIMGSNTLVRRKQSGLQRVRDNLFSTVVFSVGMFVSVSFWGLYNVDRDLIFPKVFDSWFPHWLNHNVHTTPGVGGILELFFVPHTFPRRSKGLAAVALFGLVYLLWVCVIAYQSGHWVYPVLANQTIPGRVVFITFMAILISLFYLVGETLNAKFWGVEGKGKEQKQKVK